jgi:membrane protease YdiL (CAAX protease family)
MTNAFTWPRTIALHLLPGLLAVITFATTAPIFAAAGLPPVWGMFLAVVLVVAPVELGVVRYYGAKLDLQALDRWDLVRLLLPTLAAAALAPGLVQWAEPALHRAFHEIVPVWWDLDPNQATGQPRWVIAATMVGWALTLVVIGPLVEELYFRGFLLPRIPAGRAAATLTNAALFAVYHFWQPYAWLTVFVFALPLAVVASRPRGVVVAAIVHCVVNALTFALLLSGVGSR